MEQDHACIIYKELYGLENPIWKLERFRNLRNQKLSIHSSAKIRVWRIGLQVLYNLKLNIFYYIFFPDLM